MKYSLGLISLDGISLGVISGTMLRLLPKQNTNQDNLLAGVALMIYGVGCIIGGYLGGKLCDKL
jgi:predicted MFS family arabinose efflux permease